MARVSVLFPGLRCWQYGGWRERLDGTLAQLGDIEVVISADDETLSLLPDDPRIVKLRRAEHMSFGQAAQACGEVATGAYNILQTWRIAYRPGALLSMAEHLDASPGTGFVYGDVWHQHRNKRHRTSGFDPEIAEHSFIPAMAYMYRAEYLRRGFRYDKMQIYVGAADEWVDLGDRDFYMQMVRAGVVGAKIDRILWDYAGPGALTQLMEQHRDEIDALWRERWGR
jgi:hypothetical protein